MTTIGFCKNGLRYDPINHEEIATGFWPHIYIDGNYAGMLSTPHGPKYISPAGSLATAKKRMNALMVQEGAIQPDVTFIKDVTAPSGNRYVPDNYDFMNGDFSPVIYDGGKDHGFYGTLFADDKTRRVKPCKTLAGAVKQMNALMVQAKAEREAVKPAAVPEVQPAEGGTVIRAKSPEVLAYLRTIFGTVALPEKHLFRVTPEAMPELLERLQQHYFPEEYAIINADSTEAGAKPEGVIVIQANSYEAAKLISSHGHQEQPHRYWHFEVKQSDLSQMIKYLELYLEEWDWQIVKIVTTDQTEALKDMATARLADHGVLCEAEDWIDALLEWIDSVPQATPLPAMPGIDRDSLEDFRHRLKASVGHQTED